MGASRVSAIAGVREALFQLQRLAGEQGGVVLEGRDIGTVVFPDAEVKFFLTASPEVRARRRYDELTNAVSGRLRRDARRSARPRPKGHDAPHRSAAPGRRTPPSSIHRRAPSTRSSMRWHRRSTRNEPDEREGWIVVSNRVRPRVSRAVARSFAAEARTPGSVRVLPNDLDFVVSHRSGALAKRAGPRRVGNALRMREARACCSRSSRCSSGREPCSSAVAGCPTDSTVTASSRIEPSSRPAQIPKRASMLRFTASSPLRSICPLFEQPAWRGVTNPRLKIVLDTGGIVLATARPKRTRCCASCESGPGPGQVGTSRARARVVRGPNAGACGNVPSRSRRRTRALHRFARSGPSDPGGRRARLHVPKRPHLARPRPCARSWTRLARAAGPLRTIADSVKLAREAEVLRLRASVPFAVLAELH